MLPVQVYLWWCFQKKKYAAVSNGLMCACGDTDYTLHGQSVNCKIPCPGNSTQICGGSRAASVYLAG